MLLMVGNTPQRRLVFIYKQLNGILLQYPGIFDNVKFHEANILNNINGTEELHKSFFIILNLSVGVNWPGQTIDIINYPPACL